MGDDILVSQASELIQIWTTSYYIWVTVYFAICISIILLPALVAVNVFGQTPNRVLAGITAALGAILTWSNLGVVSANFDKARSDLRVALIQYDIEKNKAKLLEAYEKANSTVRSSNPGIPQSPSVSTPQSTGTQR